MFRSGTRAETKATQDTAAPEIYPTEPSEEELADHGMHVQGETCGRCGREMKATDDARRTAKGEIVHLSC